MSSRTYRAAFAALLTSLATLTLAAPASAEDPREELPSPDPVVLKGYCPGFTAVVTYTDFNQYIVQQTTDPDTGITTLQISGSAKATVTNQATGEFVTLNISGPGTIVIYPDGSFSIDASGPNLLWTLRRNLRLFPDVPTISYSTGHVTLFVDGRGQTTSYSLAGGARQTDVCAVLAS